MRDATSLHRAVLPYVRAMKLFWSPATRLPFRPNASLDGCKLSSFKHPDEVVLLYSNIPEPGDTRAVAFADGRVRAVEVDEWEEIAAQLVQARKLRPR